jgi:hypothetical protein
VSDLLVFDTASPSEVKRVTRSFVERCEAVIEGVFYKEDDVRQAFVRWFMEMMAATPDPELILHEDPLYITARFLGFDPSSKDFQPFEQRYVALAKKQGW